MIANYHTHTHRCNHAIGREEDYVKEALKAGMKILGWADHTPYLFPGGYYSHFRMRPVQLPGYVKTMTLSVYRFFHVAVQNTKRLTTLTDGIFSVSQKM